MAVTLAGWSHVYMVKWAYLDPMNDPTKHV